VQRKLLFTAEAQRQLTELAGNPSKNGILKQVRKPLGYLETNPRHPGLQTHEFTSLAGVGGEKVFESYAQNNTPGAYRVFWHYGPDETANRKRISTIIAITPHP